MTTFQFWFLLFVLLAITEKGDVTWYRKFVGIVCLIVALGGALIDFADRQAPRKEQASVYITPH